MRGGPRLLGEPGMSDSGDSTHPVSPGDAGNAQSPTGSQQGAVVRQNVTRGDNPSEYVVDRTRAWTGMWVVAAGDVAIVVAAVWGVVKAAGSTTSDSNIVAILASAFTAIGTMTTAYFGIKSSANTAQHYRPQTVSPSPAVPPPTVSPPPTATPPPTA